MELHEKIRIVRQAKRMQQTEVANKSKMAVTTYNMKENGNRTIKPKEIEMIALALGEKPDIFFAEDFHEKWKLTKETA